MERRIKKTVARIEPRKYLTNSIVLEKLDSQWIIWNYFKFFAVFSLLGLLSYNIL